MISQEHVDEIQQREQAPSPVEDKHHSVPVKEQHTQVPAWYEKGRSLRLRILGVLVPILGGFLIFAFPLSMHQPPFQTNSEMLLTAGVLGFYGAILLRSWWALLIVPFAATIGMLLGANLPFIFPGKFELVGWAENQYDPLSIVLYLGLVPAIIGAAIGVPVSMWWERLSDKHQVT